MKRLLFRTFLVFGTILPAAAVSHAQSSRAAGPEPALYGETQTARPATSVAQRLAGAWQLVARTVRRSDGTVLADPVLGEKPLGRLYYDASGVVSLQMMRLGRAAAIGKPSNPQDSANARVILGYDSYFGRYTVDERAGTITHRVEGSLFPEDLGKDFVRGFTLDGDTLTLKFTSTADGSEITRTLVFQRLR
jgi:Lipocalin-like domain